MSWQVVARFNFMLKEGLQVLQKQKKNLRIAQLASFIGASFAFFPVDAPWYMGILFFGFICFYEWTCEQDTLLQLAIYKLKLEEQYEEDDQEDSSEE